jgi:lysozyme
MLLSSKGLALLKASEGFRSRVYLDADGLPTIGYGHRLLHPESFPNGICEAEAAQILIADIRDAERAIAQMVKVPLAQGQFDALVDFVFNLGSGRLHSSTLLVDLNKGRIQSAAQQILLWDHVGAEVNAGLKTRRQAEFELFTGQPATGQPATQQTVAA